MRTKFSVLLATAFLAGCLGMTKTPHAPNDVNLRYMYVTVYPDESTLTVTVEFSDNTPTFRDSRVTRLHEPVSYSIDQRKVKRIQIVVTKSGWVKQEREYIGQVPYDIFVKLDNVP